MRRLVGALVAISTSVGCNSSTSPTTNSSDFVTAVVNGAPFRASIAVALRPSPSTLSLTALEGCASGYSLTLNVRRLGQQTLGVGTYASAVEERIGSAGSFSLFREFIGELTEMSSGAAWSSSPGFSDVLDGAVQLTEVTNTRVTGTFSFNAAPRFGSGGTGTRAVTAGSFSVPVRDRPIC